MASCQNLFQCGVGEAGVRDADKVDDPVSVVDSVKVGDSVRVGDSVKVGDSVGVVVSVVRSEDAIAGDAVGVNNKNVLDVVKVEDSSAEDVVRAEDTLAMFVASGSEKNFKKKDGCTKFYPSQK
ncbi:hypothetical protein BGZ76_010871 [Entomortierella beljakovae]|nr:hypothetical protein BGZ76_010871 [Entomortierella beljakovae]